MSSVDDLIGELFPDKTKPHGPSPTPQSSAQETHRKSSWDSSDSETERSGAKNAGPPRGPYGHRRVATAAPKRASNSHDFDDESDDGGSDPASTDDTAPGRALPRRSTATEKHNTLFAVPFPSHAQAAGLPSCAARCFVTARLAAVRSSFPRPSVEALRSVAAGKYDAGTTPQQMMLRKAAYYVQTPAAGNGCQDGGVGGSAGGCPNIVCRKCSYVVIRLQDAEWVDGSGTTDLYLTMRNYYPDWSRLASSLPVGLSEEKQKRNGLVLRDMSGSAAYCCQCSWLTVSSDRALIETKAADVVAYATEGNSFSTRLPVTPGGKQRPPLWLCKGHSLA